jgi:type II secretory pathway pseudopilin PulG
MSRNPAELVAKRSCCVAAATKPAPKGITLLEVLVACAILIFALSGIAAILPAAGSRLAESVAEDRAAVLSANVYAELKARQFLKSAIFDGVPPVSASPNQQSETLVFGNLGPTLDWTGTAANASINAQKQAPFFFTNPMSLTSSGTTAIDRAFDAVWPYASLSFKATPENCRGFFLEDDLSFGDANGTPTSRYETMISGSSFGPRAFKRGPTWGATLARLTTGLNPPPAAAPAELSIAIFKKAADARGIDLDRITDSLYRLPNAGQETIRRTFLKPCSYVLALPIGSSATPPPGAKWFRVNSSWERASDRVSFISLPDETRLYLDGSTNKLCVIGFSNLLRLDVYRVTLD